MSDLLSGAKALRGRASPASSATQAPSRIWPSDSTAGDQAGAGTWSTAWWTASVIVIPTE
jgi:hypothetical protein